MANVASKIEPQSVYVQYSNLRGQRLLFELSELCPWYDPTLITIQIMDACVCKRALAQNK